MNYGSAVSKTFEIGEPESHFELLYFVKMKSQVWKPKSLNWNKMKRKKKWPDRGWTSCWGWRSSWQKRQKKLEELLRRIGHHTAIAAATASDVSATPMEPKNILPFHIHSWENWNLSKNRGKNERKWIGIGRRSVTRKMEGGSDPSDGAILGLCSDGLIRLASYPGAALSHCALSLLKQSGTSTRKRQTCCGTALLLETGKNRGEI